MKFTRWILINLDKPDTYTTSHRIGYFYPANKRVSSKFS